MAEVPGSILDSVKKLIGFESDYTDYDVDIIMHINSVFATLHQLGVGPEQGFMIEDNTAIWDEFTDENKFINSVKTYVYMKVRLIIDPPATSFAIAAIEKQIQELEWRLNVQQEGERHPWVPTYSTPLLPEVPTTF